MQQNQRYAHQPNRQNKKNNKLAARQICRHSRDTSSIARFPVAQNKCRAQFCIACGADKARFDLAGPETLMALRWNADCLIGDRP